MISDFIHGRLRLVTAVALTLPLLGCESLGLGTEATAEGGDVEQLKVKQDRGNIVYWVKPGPRRLSESCSAPPRIPR